MADEKKVFVHITPNKKREGLPEFAQGDPCPKCGGQTEDGFGMAGGGFGVYTYCTSCGEVVTKSEFPDE